MDEPPSPPRLRSLALGFPGSPEMPIDPARHFLRASRQLVQSRLSTFRGNNHAPPKEWGRWNAPRQEGQERVRSRTQTLCIRRNMGDGGGLDDGQPVTSSLLVIFPRFFGPPSRAPVYKKNDSLCRHQLFPLYGHGMYLGNNQAGGAVVVRSSAVDSGNTGIQLQFESALCQLSRVWFCPVPVRRLNPTRLPCLNPNFLVPSRLYFLDSLDYKPLPICLV